MNFDQQIITLNYYSVLNIVSDLGGIGATVTLIVGLLATLFLIHFIFDISNMIKRKQIHKAKKIKVKKIITHIPKLIKNAYSMMKDLKK